MKKHNLKGIFKRVMAAALSTVVIATTVSTISASAADLKYDFNGDGTVDSKDVCMLVNCSEIYSKYPSDEIEVVPYEGSSWCLRYNGEDISDVYPGFEFTEEAFEKVMTYGDINADGSIDSEDSTDFQVMLIKDGNLFCDFNENGILDVYDMHCIAEVYAIRQSNNEDIAAELIAARRDLTLASQFGDLNCDGTVNAMDGTPFFCYLDRYVLTRGDANCDGVIDSVDASLVLSYYTAVQTNDHETIYEIEEEIPVKRYFDANVDGKINAVDASIILGIYTANQTSK